MGLEEKLKEVEETVSKKESKKEINNGLRLVFIFFGTVLFISLMLYTCVSAVSK